MLGSVSSHLPPRKDALITTFNVQAALKMLLYSTHNQRVSPLEALWIIDQRLLDPDAPSLGEGRHYTLMNFLIELISEEMIHHRKMNDLPLPSAAHTRKEIFEQIEADGKTGNIELLSWSWLYYRYVRVELNISLEEFSRIAHIDARTHTRYRTHAVHRLTEKVIVLEYQARQTLRIRRLLARLPHIAHGHVFGREVELFTLWNNLTLSSIPVIQVTGASGIGKTAVVRETVRRLIKADRLVQFAWIDAPRSLNDLVDQLRFYLPNVLLDDNVPLFNTQTGLIVIDDLSHLHLHVDALQVLMSQWSPLRIRLIYTEIIPLNLPYRNVPIDAMSLDDARSLIRGLARSGYTEENILSLWQMTNGNAKAMIDWIQDELQESH